MNIALAQLNYHIGNFEANTAKIIEAITSAKAQGVDLIVFAELAIGGYPAQDLLHNKRFIESCRQSVKEIISHCNGIACIIGAPIKNRDPEGKPLYNGALVIEDGQINDMVKKSFLPDYDVFDEYRYFEPNKQVHCVQIAGQKIALTVCEDLWDDDDSNSYVGDIMADLRKEEPTLIINIAASPFSYTHFDKRLTILKQQAKKAACPLIYVNQVGAHTDIIFDGRSIALDKNGNIIKELKSFEEDLQLVNIFSDTGKDEIAVKSEIALIHDALLLGLRDYFQKSGFKKAVIGLSGGLDSAIVAALACEALGADQVLTVLMPSIYSSDHSIKDALDLVQNTGCAHLILPIKEVAEAFDSTLNSTFQGLKPDTTEENIQARIRGTLLMAVSNKFGHIVLNTSNKSEAAVGYGTLYGDMAGSISVIGDVYKTQAYALAQYINRNGELIPENTLVKAPSAELRPDQKDADSLPPYELLDSILFQFIELGKSASEVISLGFDSQVVERVNKLLNNAEFKRFQAPPILRVSAKAFGSGRSMPLVAKYPF